ncbi:MAG: GNAT family N-acetyltransferase [Pseudomonadota bacterium]
MLTTDRLTLRPFGKTDLEAFAALHADPDSMRDYGAVMSRDQCEARLHRIIEAWRRDGYGRYAIRYGGAFAGYAGVMRREDADHPLGPHDEIGWRLLPRFWGRGLATEAARAVLVHAVQDLGLRGILAYTAPDNHASQRVMARLGLIRATELDFAVPVPRYFEHWQGLVWRVPAHFGGIE